MTAFLRDHPEIAVTVVYLAASGLGLLGSSIFYGSLGINYLAFAGAADYFLAAFQNIYGIAAVVAGLLWSAIEFILGGLFLAFLALYDKLVRKHAPLKGAAKAIYEWSMKQATLQAKRTRNGYITTIPICIVVGYILLPLAEARSWRLGELDHAFTWSRGQPVHATIEGNFSGNYFVLGGTGDYLFLMTRSSQAIRVVRRDKATMLTSPVVSPRFNLPAP